MTSQTPDGDTLAEMSDQELQDQLAAAWARRLTLGDLRGRATRGESLGYGVQQWSESDYPTWDDTMDWDDDRSEDPAPLRFTTAEEARAWADLHAEAEFRRRHAQWARTRDRCLPRAELYQKRVQCLKDAGLWTRAGERTSPLIRPAGPGHEPRRDSERGERVVPDAEMWDPFDPREWPAAHSQRCGDDRG